MGKLTAKQALFVKEYLVDLNATQAAIRAGYSKKTARIIGAQNLAKINIQEAIAEGTQGRNEKLELNGDVYLTRNHNIARTTINDFMRWDSKAQEMVMRPHEEIPEYAWSAVKKLDVIDLPLGSGKAIRVELYSPDPSIKNGLTMNGKLVEKKIHELGGKDGGPIQNKFVVEFVDAPKRDT